MIEIKQRGTGSWLDPRSSKALAAKLSTRLADRCTGEKGVVITLTYNREEYESSRALYHAARDEQHVPLFLRKIGRRLSETLTGRWFCKMEFQRGGWVHWHIILLGVSRIDHAVLKEAWGRGHVWITRLNPKALTYLSKYVAKPGGVPPWIYAERARSVEIIRTSPGFWCKEQGGEDEVYPFIVPDEDLEDPYPYGHLHPDEPEPPEPARYTADIYEPIGSKIERQRERCVARDHLGRSARGDVDLGVLLVVLMEMGCGTIGRRKGWLVVDADLSTLARAEAVAARRREAADASALHSIKSSNPDVLPLRSSIPRWLDTWFSEGARGSAC